MDSTGLVGLTLDSESGPRASRRTSGSGVEATPLGIIFGDDPRVLTLKKSTHALTLETA